MVISSFPTTIPLRRAGCAELRERCYLEEFVNSFIRVFLKSRVCQVWGYLTLVYDRPCKLLFRTRIEDLRF